MVKARVYTREDDAKIAEALGWTRIYYDTGTKHLRGVMPPGEHVNVPTYASDPSPDTEWEIQSWGAEQADDVKDRINDALHSILAERFLGDSSAHDQMVDAILFDLELGDWALALLEVLKDE